VQVGWQLGSILFEINSLPWSYDPGYQETLESSAVEEEGEEPPLPEPAGGAARELLLLLGMGAAAALLARARTKSDQGAEGGAGGATAVELPVLASGAWAAATRKSHSYQAIA